MANLPVANLTCGEPSFFMSSGIRLECKDKCMIGDNGQAMTSAPSFKNLAGNLSIPVALLAVSPFNRFSISSSLTVEK